MFGLLNLNKPAGWTSRDVVNRVERLVHPAKAGHAGTLDPLATGVLVVCVGPATRLIEYVQRMPKQYRGTFRLGVTSDSDDTELELRPLASPPLPTWEEIGRTLSRFVGEIEQHPPAYSAVKLKGRRAYDLARQGQEVNLAPRRVRVDRLAVVRYDYPELVLDITCGSGTYIRALGRDLAESLGTAAVMSGLVRTAIGEFHVADAVGVENLTPEAIRAHLRPAAEAVAQVPQIRLSRADVEEVRHGRTIERDTSGEEEVAALDPSGKLVAILKPRYGDRLGPRMVFQSA